LEASPAEYRPALDRAEGNRSLSAAFGAENLSLAQTARITGCSLGLAFLAVFWVVHEVLFIKEQLLPCGKNECIPTVDTS
jgi:hypothetical protein